MKKLILFLLAPFLMATQCDDDFDNSGFETSYLLENNSGTTLYFLNEQDQFSEITSQSTISIGSTLNPETEAIAPSESFIFSAIRLFRSENGSFLLVYEQRPISDELWMLREPSVNRYEYSLRITDDLID